MTLRRKLGLRYAAVAGLCLLLLVGLAHHEFIVEPRVRRELGQLKPSGSTWGEYAEMVFHGLIPVVLGVGWWWMRRTLKPINELAQAVERIHPGNLRDPLPQSRRGDEVDRLAEVFEGLTSRLNDSFQQIREFTLHASHELKTPLTVMRVQLESLLREEAEFPPAHRDWVRAQLDEVQRLAHIVDSLTLLTKADAGLVTLEHQRLPLAELVRECLEDARVLGEAQGLTIALGACEPVWIQGDRHRLRQLLLNLADNAVKYNEPGGNVTLSLRRANGFAEIAVANTGAGLPAAWQERVFDRFVRGPDARQRPSEGCGLGLSLCRWIVQAHGGTIELSTDDARLTTTRVRLPCLPA